MNLTQIIFDYSKGMKLGKQLISEELTISFYRDYINSTDINNFFKLGFKVSELHRQHISYSTLSTLISPAHKIYGNNPETVVIRSGPKSYLSR